MRSSCIVLFLSFAASVTAAPKFELGGRYLASIIRDDTQFAGGTFEIPTSLGFAVTGEVFWTPRVSTQISSTFLQPEAILFPAGGGDIDLGTLGINLTNVLFRVHARTDARVSLLAGAGVSFARFGDLDDRFDTKIEAGVEETQTFAVEAGFRCRLSPTVWLEGIASYIPVEPDVVIRKNDNATRLPQSLKLNPIILAVGVAKRF